MSLKTGPDGFYLVSSVPLKMLHINESLYHLLEHIRDGGGIEDFISHNPVMNQENILKVLLMLVGGGYLKLDKVEAEIFLSFPLSYRCVMTPKIYRNV